MADFTDVRGVTDFFEDHGDLRLFGRMYSGGGGACLEAWVKNKHSGTEVAIPKLDAIMGCDGSYWPSWNVGVDEGTFALNSSRIHIGPWDCNGKIVGGDLHFHLPNNVCIKLRGFRVHSQASVHRNNPPCKQSNCRCNGYVPFFPGSDSCGSCGHDKSAHNTPTTVITF